MGVITRGKQRCLPFAMSAKVNKAEIQDEVEDGDEVVDDAEMDETIEADEVVSESKVEVLEHVKVLTKDNERLVPQELAEDPVSSATEDEMESVQRRIKFKRCQNPEDRKDKKIKKFTPANTLLKMWKPNAVAVESDSSPGLMSPESNCNSPIRANGIVVLKVPKDALKLLSESASLESKPQKRKRPQRRQVALMSDEDCDAMIVEETLSPPTPPKSSDDDAESRVYIDISEAVKEVPKKPIHPFFVRNKTVVEDVPTDADTDTENTTTLTLSASRIKENHSTEPKVGKPIHPFFLPNKTTESIASDIGSQSIVDSSAFVPACWPSALTQHVKSFDRDFDTSVEETRHRVPRSQSRIRKLKSSAMHISQSEDVVLNMFSGLRIDSLHDTSRWIKPTRRVVSLEYLNNCARSVTQSRHPYVQYLLDERVCLQSAFDKADYEEQMWSTKYAPVKSEQVAVHDDAALLVRKWLHTRMEGGVERSKTYRASKSRSKPKPRADLDGFIAYSDDEQVLTPPEPVSSSDEDRSQDPFAIAVDEADDGGVTTEDDEDLIMGGYVQRRQPRRSARTRQCKKHRPESRLRPRDERPSKNSNVLILCGPTASFKSAAVYAAATELGYFVFEINAGQRRTGKDILDQVGEMSQSHLVHSKQTASKSFLLVEDVDVVFEEDKGFWVTLTKLIETSKRPVILTCTDIRTIPPDIVAMNPGSLLYMKPIDDQVKVDILLLIALCEGHLLSKLDLGALLRWGSCPGDLRQAIAQLQLWCQMAVGDEYKGLDWVLVPPRGKKEEYKNLRVLSENTFTTEMLQLVDHTRFEDIAAVEISTELSDLQVLECAYDMYSCCAMWQSRQHTMFEVDMVSLL
ncbi:hypothetical protein V1512DRAFT_70277 [Lipomyces arxii]|uniref:uncharacterized protein n=1 Tax=Lipomyces arxii TaxID=56418 RepID=UPI0034CEF415